MRQAPLATSSSTTTLLSFTAFGALAFDPVHGRAFVSAGKLDSRIAVLDTSGKPVKLLSGFPARPDSRSTRRTRRSS